jgi:hypothetical protein
VTGDQWVDDKCPNCGHTIAGLAEGLPVLSAFEANLNHRMTTVEGEVGRFNNNVELLRQAFQLLVEGMTAKRRRESRRKGKRRAVARRRK